ncbi:hypothetical protein GA0070606_4465 [Micromonospora citrea]|uniref:Uncharacterized protein n=1 Tax=Micromonospora citrea TaxID=47855 RepID=A0A1C6VLA3_9ACTN|nr:hypothetical protein GA0070606_4465 [Micromonospora citrea]
MLGVLLMVFGLLPLAGGGFVVAHAFSNSRQGMTNPQFLPKAWHNLPAEQLLPERLGSHQFAHAWSRQGVDTTSSCEKAGLKANLAKAVRDNGCKAVLRATYVDTSATHVATLALIVLSTPQQARDLHLEFDRAAGDPGELVEAYPVPGTPAAGWKNSHRAGVAVYQLSPLVTDQPYLVAVSLGYADGRAVPRLPQPWTLPAPGSANEHSLDSEATYLIDQYRHTLDVTLRGNEEEE